MSVRRSQACIAIQGNSRFSLMFAPEDLDDHRANTRRVFSEASLGRVQVIERTSSLSGFMDSSLAHVRTPKALPFQSKPSSTAGRCV